MVETEQSEYISHEQLEVLSRRLNDIAQEFDLDQKHAIIFLDSSARPLAKIFRKEWNNAHPETQTPVTNFLNFGTEKIRILVEVIANNSDPNLFSYINKNTVGLFKLMLNQEEIIRGDNSTEAKNDAAYLYYRLRMLIPDLLAEFADMITLDEFVVLYGVENVGLIMKLEPKKIALKNNEDSSISDGSKVITIIDDFEITGNTKRLLTALVKRCHPDCTIRFIPTVESDLDKLAFAPDEYEAPYMPWAMQNFEDRNDRPLFNKEIRQLSDDRSFLIGKTEEEARRERAISLYKSIEKRYSKSTTDRQDKSTPTVNPIISKLRKLFS